MFGSIGMSEIVIIFGVALVVIGPEKFPDFAKIAMRTFRDLRGYVDEAKAEIAKEIKPVKEEMRELSKHKPEEYLDALTKSDSDSDEYGSEYGDEYGQDTPVDNPDDNAESDLAGEPYESYSEQESRWPSDSQDDEAAAGGTPATETQEQETTAAQEDPDDTPEADPGAQAEGEDEFDDDSPPQVERLDG
jgi:sec-independent protein translocase protein TatB